MHSEGWSLWGCWALLLDKQQSSARNIISVYCLNSSFISYSHKSPSLTNTPKTKGKPQKVALSMHINTRARNYMLAKIGQAFSSGAAFPLPGSHHLGKDHSKCWHNSTDISGLTNRCWNTSLVLTWLGFGGLAVFSASLLFPPMIHVMAAAAQPSQCCEPSGGSVLVNGQKGLELEPDCSTVRILHKCPNKGDQSQSWSKASVTGTEWWKGPSVRAGGDSFPHPLI